MKIKNLKIAFLIATISLLLVACGGQQETINSSVETQSQENIESATPTPTIEPTPTLEPTPTPTLEPTPSSEPSFNEEVTHYDYTSEENNENVVIWQKLSIMNENPDLAKHTMHFTNSKGYPMTYAMVGPSSMCNNAYIDAKEGTTCCIYDNNYELRMWGCELDAGKRLEDYGMDNIITWSYGTYVDGTYQIETTDEYSRVWFKVDLAGNMTGYAYYIVYYDTMDAYQFEYLESNDVFDDERALSVVQSIERVEVTE